MSHLGRGWPFLNGFDLVVHHANTVAADVVTKELDFVLEEFTLGLLGVEFLLAEDAEDLANVVLVLFECLAEDEDVVEEHEDELVEERAKGLMHEVHERGGSVGEAEGEHEEFEVTVAGAEGGLGNIAGVDANLMVAGAEVNLGEILGTLKAVEEFVDARQRVAVLDGDVVECAIVDAHASGSVLLLDEQDRSAEGRLGGLDEASGSEFVELRAEFSELRGGHVVGRARRWSSTG